jgi:hypothetical protein
MSNTTGYEADFYAWANEQAALLRAGQLGAADIENIAEELESMGRSEKRELTNRLIVLLAHLLKWQFQPKRRSGSWKATITIQRIKLVRYLRDNPSLKVSLEEAVEDSYGAAIKIARDETGLAKSAFPTTLCWSWAQITDEEFWPG